MISSNADLEEDPGEGGVFLHSPRLLVLLWQGRHAAIKADCDGPRSLKCHAGRGAGPCEELEGWGRRAAAGRHWGCANGMPRQRAPPKGGAPDGGTTAATASPAGRNKQTITHATLSGSGSPEAACRLRQGLRGRSGRPGARAAQRRRRRRPRRQGAPRRAGPYRTQDTPPRRPAAPAGAGGLPCARVSDGADVGCSRPPQVALGSRRGAARDCRDAIEAGAPQIWPWAGRRRWRRARCAQLRRTVASQQAPCPPAEAKGQHPAIKASGIKIAIQLGFGPSCPVATTSSPRWDDRRHSAAHRRLPLEVPTPPPRRRHRAHFTQQPSDLNYSKK